MGHSGGGAVVDDLAGMIERKTGADVSAVVTLGSPISNYDVAGRYAEQVVDLQHRFDFVGKSYIRSDESRYALPLAMMSAPTPVQGVLRAVGLEQTLWRSVDDSPNVKRVTNRGATDDAHGSLMRSAETGDALARLFPEMQLNF